MTVLRGMPTIARGGRLASVALAAMLMAQGAAAAETASGEVPRVLVSYADLRLASPLDAGRLLQRIADAAIEVCGDPSATLDLSARARRRGCVSTAITRAVETVASAKLTLAYVQSRYAPRHLPPLSPRAASIAARPGR